MSAAGMIQMRGAAVDFTLTSPGAYDAATDSGGAPSVSTVSCYAIEVEGDPKEYEALGLTQHEAHTLHCTPVTPGQVPADGAVISWAAATMTVRRVKPTMQNGTATRVRVVVAR